jgi:hypothetical protein
LLLVGREIKREAARKRGEMEKRNQGRRERQKGTDTGQTDRQTVTDTLE